MTIRTAIADGVATARLLEASAEWSYQNGDLNLFPTPWARPSYGDEHWPSGPQPLGYALPVNTVLSDSGSVVYFLRTDVQVDIEPLSASLSIARDDGAIVFIDGVEILRDNVAAGSVDSSTMAQAPMMGSSQTEMTTHAVDPALLTPGRHVLAVSLHQAVSAGGGSTPWINELHYDNDGYDRNEGVEIAGAAGTDLDSYTLYFYDGDHGTVYRTVNLEGTIPDESGGAGTIWFDVRGIRSEDRDGLALVRQNTNVVEFISYDGRQTATEGPAAGMTATELPVEEDDSSVGTSLQRTGSGSEAGDFNWVGPRLHSRGSINAGQSITHDPADLFMDMRLDLVIPDLPVIRNLALSSVSPRRDAMSGDVIPVDVLVRNDGNRTESFTIVVLSPVTGEEIGRADVRALAPVVQMEWNTAGLPAGTHDLIARIVQDGVTNSVGSVSGLGLVSDGLGLKKADGTGAVGGGALAVASAPSSNWTALGEGAVLSLVDLSAPSSPARLAALPMPGRVEAIAIGNMHVYAACGEHGVQVVNVQNPAAPVHVRTLDTPGHASDITIDGNHLLIADGVTGLRIADITTPAEPSVIGHLVTGGAVRKLAVSGGYAILADAFEGVVIVDLSDPSRPVRVGTLPEAGFGTDVALQGGYAWLPTSDGRCLLIDLSDPAAPLLAGGFMTGYVNGGAAVNGSYLYVAAGPGGLLAYDISDPMQPIAAESVAGTIRDLAVNGSLLLAAGDAEGLVVVNTAGLVRTGSLPSAARAVRAAFRNDLAFVASGESGLQVYSLTNPVLPRLVGSFADMGNARDVVLHGALALVADAAGFLDLLNIQNLDAITRTSRWNTPAAAPLYAVRVDGDVAIAAGYATLWLIDLSDPAAPVQLGSLELDGHLFDIDAANGLAAIAGGDAGLILVRTTGGLPVRSGSYDTGGHVVGVRLEGDLAWIADAEQGWLALDVSDPDAPVLAGPGVDVPAASGLSMAGRYLAVGGDGADVVVTDRSNLLQPVEAARLANLAGMVGLQAGDGFLAVLRDDEGMIIAELAGADQDNDGLDDAWEQALVDADPGDELRGIEDIEPDGDLDGDGLSNRQEFIAGSGADDAASVFMARTGMDASAGLTLRWPSSPGRTYRILRAESLDASFAPVAEGIAATPPQNRFTVSMDDGPGFFLVVAEEP